MVHNQPADLISVALEALVAASLELPVFSTLDRLVRRLRSEANRVIFDRVTAAMAAVERESLDRLLVVPPEVRKSAFQRLKDSAGRATWSALRSQLELIDWLDGIGPTERWLAGIADAKIADFAGKPPLVTRRCLARWGP